MPQDNDRIRQAADALDALGAAQPQPDEPAEQPLVLADAQPTPPPQPEQVVAEAPIASEPTSSEPVAAGPAEPAPAASPANSEPTSPAEAESYPIEPAPIVATLKKPGKAKISKIEEAGPREPRPSTDSKRRRPILEMHQITTRRTFIPVLLITGLVMVGLGCWALGVLVFETDLLRGGTVDGRTRHLARLMLLAWPVGAVLLGGAAFLMHEVYAWYRQRL